MQSTRDEIDVLTLLVIEDNLDDAEILESHLLKISCKKMTLVFRESLKLGLSRLAQGGIDVILLDLSLPDSHGLDSLTEIRKIAPLIPLVVLTGSEDYALSLQALRMGAQDYLLKRQLDASALDRSIDYARARQRGAEVSEFLASLVQSSVDAIIGRSLAGKIVSWNSGAEKMFGYTAAEVIGRSFEFLVPEDRLGEASLTLKKSETDLSIDYFESVRVRKDGSRLPVSLSVSPLRNSEGLLAGAVIVARDITLRLLAEKDLSESNQRLQLAVHAAKVGIWSWDTRADAIIWDDRMGAFFGLDSEDYAKNANGFFEVTLGSFMEAVHLEDREKVRQALATALEQSSTYECSYRIIWPDKTLHYIAASGELSFDPNEARTNMIGVCMDITERTLMEQEAREVTKRREQIAGAIVQHAPVGIVTLDADLRIIDVNSAFATMARRRITELLLKPLAAVLPEVICQRARESIQTGSSFQLFRFNIALPARSVESSHYWDLSFWPVLSSQGSTTGAILQVADCTSAVMLEEQRDDFVAAVAHDIKNPLIGAARVLDHLCSEPEEAYGRLNHEILIMLRDSNNGLLGLVQNLVDVHHYETLGYPVVRAEVNLFDNMVSCIKQNKYFSDSRQVTIHLEEMTAPLIVSADSVGLSRVFMNLLHNAIKFSYLGSSIQVSIAMADPAHVEISISDTGDGISNSDQKKLFQRYGQAEAGKRKPNSTGLGLYLSRQIIDAHDGEIACRSELGVGSTFSVRLPINHHLKTTQSGHAKVSPVARIA